MSSSIRTKVTTIKRQDENGQMETIVRTEKITTVDGKETVEVTEEKVEGEIDGQPDSARTNEGSEASEKKPGFFSRLFGKKDKGGPPSLAAVRSDALKAHNEHRAKHSAPPLKASKALDKIAQEWADHVASTGQFMHRPNGQHGENIYYGFKSNATINGKDVVDTWYAEIANYDYENPKFAGNTGHFTQVVWKGSKEVGVGYVRTPEGKVYVVANYSPAGNVQGQYTNNVLPAK